MATCEHLAGCAFFQTASTIPKPAAVLDEYIGLYCQGTFQDYCHRKQHFERTGQELAANISPSGLPFR